MGMSWIEHTYGILALIACFVILWGVIGLLLAWLKACEDSYNRYLADKRKRSYIMLEAGERIKKWSAVYIGDDGKASQCGHN